MTTLNENTTITKQSFRGAGVPVFLPVNMEQPMATEAKTQENNAELSLFDVKELYDRAYAEKEGGAEDKFKAILAEAVKLDLAYRRQLSKNAVYKDPAQIKKFKSATEGSKVA